MLGKILTLFYDYILKQDSALHAVMALSTLCMHMLRNLSAYKGGRLHRLS